MEYRNVITATLALALSSLALAGAVYSDAYSQAARTEASGYRALTEQVLGGDQLACAEPALSSGSGTVTQ